MTSPPPGPELVRRLAAPLVVVAALSACGESPTGRTGLADDDDPAPAVFDWVGTWRGTGTGFDRDVPVEEDVTLVVSFDHHEECELCVRVELGDLFDRDSLLIGDPIRTEQSYVDGEGRTHRLRLQRHSTGDGAGTTIIGSVEVLAAAEGPSEGSPLNVREIVVTKDVR